MNWLIHPIQTISNWGIKKYVLGIVNEAIEKYNGNIATARTYVSRYIGKIEAILAFLDSLDAKLADGKLTEQEADAITDEAVKLAKELTA